MYPGRDWDHNSKVGEWTRKILEDIWLAVSDDDWYEDDPT